MTYHNTMETKVLEVRSCLSYFMICCLSGKKELSILTILNCIASYFFFHCIVLHWIALCWIKSNSNWPQLWRCTSLVHSNSVKPNIISKHKTLKCYCWLGILLQDQQEMIWSRKPSPTWVGHEAWQLDPHTVPTWWPRFCLLLFLEQHMLNTSPHFPLTLTINYPYGWQVDSLRMFH